MVIEIFESRNTLRVRLYQKEYGKVDLSERLNLVAILCEYDYIKRLFLQKVPVLVLTQVAILCEYDYIKSLQYRQPLWLHSWQVAILCEYDYIKSFVLRRRS